MDSPRPTSLRSDRRGAVALMVGISGTVLLGLLALIVDAGLWYVGSARLQTAADAGAMGAALLLSSTAVRAQPAATQAATFRTAAQAEIGAVATRLVGTVNAPAVTVDTTNYTWAKVVLTSQAGSYFLKVFNVAPPLLSATAVASVVAAPATPCVLALATSGTGVKADNMGTVAAVGCSVGSNAVGPQSIYLNSGAIIGSAITAVGTVAASNSGSNTMNPAAPSSNASPSADPFAARTIPAPGACNATNGNYTAWRATPYVFAPTTPGGSYVFCGDTIIGGNATTQTFAPGTYYVVNGNLTFDNAAILLASDVTFVLTGTAPGSLSWTNYSIGITALSAPTTGPTAGILVWQGCGAGQTTSFQGGSSLAVSGSIYAPCSAVQVGNNAQLNAALLGQGFTLVANTIYAYGSGAIRTAGSSSGGAGAGTTVALTQ